MKLLNAPSARSQFVLLTLSMVMMSFSIAAQKTRPQCSCGVGKVVASLPRGVKEGEVVQFSIESSNLREIRDFVWTVSAGEIISGQGTAAILVKVPDNRRGLRTLVSFPELSSDAKNSTEIPPGFVRSSLPEAGLFPVFYGRPSLIATLKVIGVSKCSCDPITAAIRLLPTESLVNSVADVTGLTLSSENLTLPCRAGLVPRAGVTPSESMIVDVATTSVDAEDDVLSYDYTVSGGRIVGTGKDVRWDLTGVNPGSYTITAGVDDGCGLCGKTKTAEVTVVKCEPTCILIRCPSISVTGPDAISGEGDYYADISGGAFMSVTYEWSVTNGVILSGQGTPSVTVKLEPTSSISVKIGGLEKGTCLSSASKEFVDGRLKP